MAERDLRVRDTAMNNLPGLYADVSGCVAGELYGGNSNSVHGVSLSPSG
jgi:hypothetical protein